MGWLDLKRLADSLGFKRLGISFSITLPSFYKNKDCKEKKDGVERRRDTEGR